MPVQFHGLITANASSGAYVPLSATSVPNRRLYVQPNADCTFSSVLAGTNAIRLASGVAGRYDFGVTDLANVFVRSNGSATTVSVWSFDPGES
jgi:hypothetical protein